VDRTIGRITAELGVYTGKEARKLAFAHFARGHGEFTVLDAAQARNVAINLHVIRRVGKNEFGLVVIHQQLVSRGIGGITADQDVLSKHPDITQTADRRPARLLGHLVFRLLTFVPDTLEDDVDLGGSKTRQEHIEAQIDKALQLDCEELVIPACLLRKTVVRKDIGLLLGLAEMGQPDSRTVFKFSSFAASTRPCPAMI